MFSNGCNYKNEDTAAHASDTLARKLMENSGQKLKLNFPDDNTEVYPEKKQTSSKYIGVNYCKNNSVWCATRWSKNQNKHISNGCYKNEERAAHASDTMARKLMGKGEPNHKLNFPDNNNEVYPEKKQTTSKFVGVTHNKRESKWYVQRWSKNENKMLYNGCYDIEQTAAHASDNLARKLIGNGEQGHKLNFPQEYIEEYLKDNQQKKRKRPNNSSSGLPQNK